jgi:hypothetical protein
MNVYYTYRITRKGEAEPKKESITHAWSCDGMPDENDLSRMAHYFMDYTKSSLPYEHAEGTPAPAYKVELSKITISYASHERPMSTSEDELPF